MDLTHREIFERHRYPGAIAALFTDDGVCEAPLPPGGREAIRGGIGASKQDPGEADRERYRHVLHETADPDVFITEIDAALIGPDGRCSTMSRVQLFRLRGGLIAHLHDCSRLDGGCAGAPVTLFQQFTEAFREAWQDRFGRCGAGNDHGLGVEGSEELLDDQIGQVGNLMPTGPGDRDG